MKEKLHSNHEIEHCPLCYGDEFLISDSGSMLCGQCGSFFENVHKVVARESFRPKSFKYVMHSSSMMAH